jgi:Head binding
VTIRVIHPFPIFLDRFGNPLDGGAVYIGTDGADPEVSPVSVYRDEALTIGVSQPLTVIGGLLTYDGNPAEFFIAADSYSIRVRDSDGAQVFYVASADINAVVWQPLDADLTTISAQTNAAFGLSLLTQASNTAARTTLGLGTAAVLDETSAAQYRANTADKVLSTDQVWSAAAWVTLTDAATIAVDMATFLNAQVTLAGNRTLGNPTNTKDGQEGCIRIVQDGTGARTLAYGANWEFAGGTAPILSVTAGAVDLLFFKVLSATSIFAALTRDVK